MTYADDERARAAAWKASTATLPPPAKLPAPYVGKTGSAGSTAYDFCLPAKHARLSLLPEVRDLALDLFEELGIPWHAGVDDGPSNHLLSSQVQCVNALGQMVTDSDRVHHAFGELLGTEEVLEIEPGRFLTFEYIGGTDFFSEAPGGARVRGSMCTSVDAAFLHRTRAGLTELALVEWKYTEAYKLRRPEHLKDATRARRYRTAVDAPDSPVRNDVLSFNQLLDEPLYQLMRQQLLAHELEKAHAHCADRVRVVHVAPAANIAYQQSLHRSAQRAVGGSVAEVWACLLRRPDRFVSLNSAHFLNPELTSLEYARRYGDNEASPGE